MAWPPELRAGAVRSDTATDPDLYPLAMTSEPSSRFLLRVTDVERQPFRSMGIVSIIIVSCLFAMGLPLVLL